MFHSEEAFVRWLQRRMAVERGDVQVGIGDDAAVVRASAGRDLIVTADFSIEGVHFSRRIHPASSVGHRALARSLSDIGAMGGQPRFALVSLALSKRLPRRWVEQFYAGLASLAAAYGVTVIGGDTSLVAGEAAADVTMLGDISRGKALLRSGARPGDLVFVSGRLGQAELGLRLLRARSLRKDWMVTPKTRAVAIRAHLYPEPRCALGKFLSGNRLASSAMDLSDGLSLDLSRLCQASGVGARLVEGQIPCPEIAPIKEARRLALSGGEDYELLFTVPPARAARLPRVFQRMVLHQIGEITRPKQLVLIRLDGKEIPLQPAGYDHFRRK
jgi:thiamine-monophosphate kinase